MRKMLSLIYGVAVYLLFLGVFVYLIGFVGDLIVPKSIGSGASSGLSAAVAINVGLLALFAVQHSVMARSWFKRWWTRIVPDHLERSTYVLLASIVLAMVMWGWQPISTVVWSVEGPVASGILHGLFWAGWGVVLLSTFLIDHFQLFGLKQVWSYARGSDYGHPEFQTPSLYRYVRHPLYLGFLLAFWSTPHMTAGRLLFAGVWTAWILLAIRFEERDLVRFHGEQYRQYQRRVPMLVPLPGGASGVALEGEEPSGSGA